MKPIEKDISPPKQKNPRFFWYFFIILFIMTTFMMFCFQPGNYLFTGHDTDFHFLRLNALMEALKDGRFPIYTDYEAVNGYGYPTKWFYPDAILIPFAFIGNFTDIITAYKILVFIITLLCGTFMYLAMQRIYKNAYISVVASLLYTFSFYRIQDLFERSALGEAISFTFIPIVFLGFYEIIKGNYKKWYILSIGMCLLIFSHVLSMLLTCLTLFIFLLIHYKALIQDKKRIYYLFLSAGATVLLSAYFLFPLLEQMSSNTFYYDTHPLFRIQNFTIDIPVILWGFSFINIFPNQNKDIFLASVGLLLGISICLRIFIREKSPAIKSVDIGVIIGIFYVIASASVFPWESYPFNKLHIIRFPWRLYEFASYFFAIAGGYYSYILFKTIRLQGIFLFFITATTLFIMYNESNACKIKFPKYNPITFERNPSNFYSQGALEYIPSKIPSIDYMNTRGDSIHAIDKETKTSNFKRHKGIIELTIEPGRKEESLELPLFYYKGYTAKLDEKDIPVRESKNGLLEVSEISSAGRIEVSYSGTFIQKISPFITLISFGIMGFYLFLSYRKRNSNLK